jgi:ABC-type antimicrobial peptide transport system permease subunit
MNKKIFEITGNFWVDMFLILIVPWFVIAIAFRNKFNWHWGKIAIIGIVALFISNYSFFSNSSYEKKYNDLLSKYEKLQNKDSEKLDNEKKAQALKIENDKKITINPTQKSTPKSTPKPTQKPTKKPTPKPTKKLVYDQSITFDQLNRDPDKYFGKGVIFSGTIIQVMMDDAGDTFRIDVGNNNIMICTYKYKNNELRLIENDKIRFQGISLGLYTYETVLGAEQTVPAVTIDNIISR